MNGQTIAQTHQSENNSLILAAVTAESEAGFQELLVSCFAAIHREGYVSTTKEAYAAKFCSNCI